MNDLEAIIQEYSEMGFDTHDIIRAWVNSNQRSALVLDHLLTIQKEKKDTPPPLIEPSKPPTESKSILSSIANFIRPNSSSNFDDQLQKAIKLSLDERDNYIKPDKLLRKDSKPVGIKNIGNTCYFNSIIQTIFQLKPFLYNILTYRAPSDPERALRLLKFPAETDYTRKKACIQLVLALQKLFVLMLYGNKNIVDPTEVTASIVNAQGVPIKVGEQVDIGEFSINFFERLQEGLLLTHKLDNDDELIDEDRASFDDVFFGTSKDSMTFEWGDIKSKKELDAVFGPISLSITQKDLLTSLDTYINFSVDEYKTPNGSTTTAKKRIWISKAPKMLTFTLQRSIYTRDKGLTKVTDAFDFPKELYIDQFLLENKKLLKEIREQKKAMRAKIRRLDAEIAGLREYGPFKTDLLSGFDTVTGFLGQQIANADKEIVEVNSDDEEEGEKGLGIGASAGALQEAKKCLEALKEYRQRVLTRIEVLEKRRTTIKEKMENALSDPMLRQKKYRLHGVVIHEGGINGGHYYTLTYNPQTHKWTKFNDSIVEDIAEEDVFKLGRGNYPVLPGAGKNSPKHPCAYCLFYVEDSAEVLDGSAPCLEELKRLLSKDLLTMAEFHNARFLTEHQHYNLNLVKKLNDEYLILMNNVSFDAAKFQNELRGRQFPFAPSLPNFLSFLLLESTKCTEIARWSALGSILSQYSIPYDILAGESGNYYYRTLRDMLVTGPCVYKLRALELTGDNRGLLSTKKQEYIVLAQALAALEYALRLLGDKKWKEGMAVIGLLHEKVRCVKMNEYTNQFFSFASYLLTITVLRFCALIDHYLAKSETKEALLLLELVLYMMNRKETIKPPESFYQQVTVNLHYTINTIGRRYMKDADIFLFTHHVKKIEEKCEFLPSMNVPSLIPMELQVDLKAIETDPNVFQRLELKGAKVQELYTSVMQTKMKTWVEFETSVRKGNRLLDQETRMKKEFGSGA